MILNHYLIKNFFNSIIAENIKPIQIPPEFTSCVHDPEFRGYMLDIPGREHYALLYSISLLIDGETLIDIGTYKGCSALALSANPKNKVMSFDINNSNILYPAPGNVQFILDNVFAPEYKDAILASPFIMLDTDHDGIFEQRFVEYLDSIKYQGFVMFDDIYLNDAMKKFWQNQSHRKINDLTIAGHWSGTGVIEYE